MAKIIHLLEAIKVPENVSVELSEMEVKVKGPKGEVKRDFSHARGVLISLKEGEILVEAYRADRKLKALVGTIAAHIRNMITGVTKGFRYKMKIVYSHFPMSVAVDNENRVIRVKNFLGEKADRIARIYGNVKVYVEGSDIVIEGADIEEVGLTASSIERATKIRDLDRRIFGDGIYIYERGVAE
ncbi:MAG: 50S ribosomal protein L6 [Desulfurococcaceae archaeon]